MEAGNEPIERPLCESVADARVRLSGITEKRRVVHAEGARGEKCLDETSERRAQGILSAEAEGEVKRQQNVNSSHRAPLGRSGRLPHFSLFRGRAGNPDQEDQEYSGQHDCSRFCNDPSVFVSITHFGCSLLSSLRSE
jgi:hypothetical protein